MRPWYAPIAALLFACVTWMAIAASARAEEPVAMVDRAWGRRGEVPPRVPTRSRVDVPSVHDLRRCLRASRQGATPRPYWYASYFRPRRCPEWMSLGASAFLAVGGGAALTWGDDAFVSDLSDLGELALDVLGYGVPAVHLDPWGVAQYAISYQLSMRINHYGKNHLEVPRPNGEAKDSFPSAHTTSAFTGATFLHGRFGPIWGVPAYTLATFVGASRVRLDKHRLTDVVAGAGLGMISAWVVALPFGGERRELTFHGLEPKWRIEFAYGAALQARNEIKAPRLRGTRFDLTRQKTGQQAYPTARFSLHYLVRPRYEVMFRIDPIEISDTTSFVENVTFDGVTLGPGEGVPTRWTANRFALRLRYALREGRRRWHVKAGLGAMLGMYEAKLVGPNRTGRVTYDELTLWPHVHVSYELLPRLRVSVNLEVGAGLYSLGVDGEARVRWRINERWDLGVGYRINASWIDAPEIRSHFEAHMVFFAIGRSF